MIKLPYLTYDKPNDGICKFKASRYPLVYLFVCEDGMVIYVGRTDRFSTRWKQHLASNKALHLVARVELHVMESDAEAHFYETEMILKYKPLWNTIGRHAKASKMQIEPVDVAHYNATPVAMYVLPYARNPQNDRVIKHWDHGKHTEIIVSSVRTYKCVPEHVLGTITVANDLSSVSVECSGTYAYFDALVEKVKQSVEEHKDCALPRFTPVWEPDAMTKSYWDGAVKRERSGEYNDYSEYDETGIVNVLPSVSDYLSSLDKFPEIANWYS